MARLYQAELQVISDDNVDADKVQQQLENALRSMEISEVFVREVNYMGDLEDPLEEDEQD